MRQPQTRLALTSANGHTAPTGKDPLPKLEPDTLEFLVVALGKQWKCYRKQLRACQSKFSEGAVHDLRVSARRLLSLLDLLVHFLAPGRLEKTQRALKRHLDTFDELRDTQVQLPAVRKCRKQFRAARRFYRFLKKRESRLTRSTCKQATRMKAKPLSKLLDAACDDVNTWLRRSGSRRPDPLLLSAVDRAFRLTQSLRARIQPDDTHSIHCTRVAFKRFRYVIEALAPCLPWANKSLLEKMHAYQTLMGDIQDAEVLLRAFQKLMRKEKLEAKAALAFEHELQERRRRFIGKYLAAADHLMEFWPPARKPFRATARKAAGNGGFHKASSRGATRGTRSVP